MAAGCGEIVGGFVVVSAACAIGVFSFTLQSLTVSVSMKFVRAKL